MTQRQAPRMPYRAGSYLCKDGKVRTDCVCIDLSIGRRATDPEAVCGKPMVGLVPFVGDGWMRLCEEHFALFTHGFEEKFGVAL